MPIIGCVLGGRAGVQVERDGEAVYLGDCAACHGTKGRGDGPVAQALKQSPADLTTLAERSGGAFPRQYVRDVITGERSVLAHGNREMPVWNEQFLPTGSGATVGAAIYAELHLEKILGYLESIQRSPSGKE
jgi:mono/diheme cytochrome c family protein